jgi:hypothetical protein
MKNILVIILCCLTLTSIGQTEIDNAVIANDNENTLFLKIANPIKIAVPGNTCNQLFVKCTNGTINGDDCRYNIVPANIGKSTVSVFTINHKDTLIAGEREFRIKRLPTPNAYMCGRQGTIKKEIAGTCRRLLFYYDAFDLDCPYEALQYEMIITKDSCKKIRMLSNDKEFTNEMKSALTNLQVNDIIEFQKIQAIVVRGDRPPVGTIEDVPDIRLRVE